MNERTEAISKGLDDARKSQEKLEEAEKMRETRLLEAKREANDILENAQEMAEKNKVIMIEGARKETQKVVDSAKKEIAEEKEKMLAEVKREVGKVVGVALEKILDEKIDSDKDQELIKKAVSEISN